MRLWWNPPVTRTRIRSASMGTKENRRQTLPLPETEPPGTGVQLDPPSEYSSSKSVIPLGPASVLSVGSETLPWVNTSISSMA